MSLKILDLIHRKLGLFLILPIMEFLLCAPGVAAQDCGAMVRDDAHIFGGDIGQVVNAAEELQNAGAQVYVRTFSTTGAEPTVDRLEHSIQDQCPGWQNADGTRKTNLVVIIYADKDSAGKRSLLISTGPGIDKLVPNREIDRIRARVIIPQIKAGRPAQGFAQALTEIKTAYEAQPVTAS